MAFVNTVDLIGDEALSAKIIDKSITEIADNITTSIGARAFIGCANLSNVDFPAVTSIGDYSFGGTAMTKVKFPAATSVLAGAFRDHNKLEVVDLPVATKIAAYAFTSCSALTVLILRSDVMCTLDASSALAGGQFISSGTGHIYVPAVLLDKYKNNYPWSDYATKFRALEDYTVDGTITGELDPTKI